MRWLVLALFVLGCLDEPRDVPAEAETSRVVVFDLPLRTARKLDLLFVIDSSPAMAAHAATLAASYRAMMQLLQALEGGLPDLRLAVVTTDLGTVAADDSAGGTVGSRCRGRGDDARFRTSPWIDDDVLTSRLYADGSRVDNFDAALPDVFTALADVGADGCELTQPLEAMRRALRARPAFVRADAVLHVVFVTAQDDCSFASASFLDDLRTEPMDTYRCYARSGALVPVETYVELLKGLHRDPSRVAVSLAAGPPGPVVTVDEWRHQFVAPACSHGEATAAPAPRLHRLLEAFPNRSTSVTLCQPDGSAVLAQLAGLPERPLGNPCLEVPLHDRDPSTATLEPICEVSYAIRQRDGGFTDEHPIPSCATADAPCWRIDTDARQCPGGSTQLIAIDHGARERAPNTHVIGQCVVE